MHILIIWIITDHVFAYTCTYAHIHAYMQYIQKILDAEYTSVYSYIYIYIYALWAKATPSLKLNKQLRAITTRSHRYRLSFLA